MIAKPMFEIINQINETLKLRFYDLAANKQILIPENAILKESVTL